ncbi:MAG: futalosine hydrolase [Firmicutes bacterium HGW-Firmicutes-14]|nr:MAG: futalosine hydrolase [Firmicutes bacterium HGW-Firmicutes-14]
MDLNQKKRVLVMTAVPIEMDAVLRGLNNDAGFDVMPAGVGPAVAAAKTAKVLAAAGYSLVVSAGIGGGFPGRAGIGSLVVATEIIAADLGVQTPEGFISLDELGFGSARIQVDDDLVSRVTGAFSAAGIPVNTGPVLTVSTGTGTTAAAREMAVRVPGAAAEAMEGYGVAIAAREAGLPVLEIRAISNMVGPRDRNAWKVKEALDILEKAGAALLEVLP